MLDVIGEDIVLVIREEGDLPVELPKGPHTTYSVGFDGFTTKIEEFDENGKSISAQCFSDSKE
jgi:hypothetical protein